MRIARSFSRGALDIERDPAPGPNGPFSSPGASRLLASSAAGQDSGLTALPATAALDDVPIKVISHSEVTGSSELQPAGGIPMKTYGWMMAFLAVAAAQFSFAYWELTVARSESARS